MEKNDFDIDIYISEICKEVGVDPNDNVFEGSRDSVEGMSLSYHDLMLSAITGNWDPAYNKYASVILNDESKFAEFVLKADIESGMPPRALLENYLHFARKFFKYGIITSNLKHAFIIELQLNLISKSFTSVLISGEPGVGKKLMAEMIHQESDRSDFPFEIIDCSGYSDEQLCSIVFGSVDSANKRIKPGVVSTTDKGTLYLEDLHESKNIFQSKLIRFLRDGTYSMTGSSELLKSKIRIIGSCSISDEKIQNQNLFGKPGLVQSFSEPAIYMPAMRFVRSNIPLLVYLCIQKAKHKFDVDEDINIKIPFIMLKHWLTNDNFPDNIYYFQNLIDAVIKSHIHLDSMFFERFFPDCINLLELFLSYWSDSQSFNNIKRVIEEATAFAHDETKVPSDNMVHFIDSSKYIEVFSLEPNELFNSPLLLPMLYYYDIENKQERIHYSAYNDVSPYLTDLGFGEFFPQTKSANNTILKTNDIPPISEYLKEKMGVKINIKEIIAEVFEKSDHSPKIEYIPFDGSEIKELIYGRDIRAEISLLIFLIYERKKTNKDGTPKTVKWGTNWLANMESVEGEEFQPFQDVCRWFGYTKEDMKDGKPAWWYNLQTLRSYLSRLKEIFRDNNISENLIVRQSRPGKPSIYHLHKDLEAEIIIN